MAAGNMNDERRGQTDCLIYKTFKSFDASIARIMSVCSSPLFPSLPLSLSLSSPTLSIPKVIGWVCLSAAEKSSMFGRTQLVGAVIVSRDFHRCCLSALLPVWLLGKLPLRHQRVEAVTDVYYLVNTVSFCALSINCCYISSHYYAVNFNLSNH